jgi:hypothetical protein
MSRSTPGPWLARPVPFVKSRTMIGVMSSTNGRQEAADDVLESVWENADAVGLDAECSPTRVCRNARDFTFDGIGDGDEDLATAWRDLLEREGKLSPDGTSVGDLLRQSPGD